jgi:chromosome segregation ATPase
MTEEKMVDLDTTGEGQEVELQEEESTKQQKVEEEKVEVSNEEKSEESSKEEEDSKDDGLDKYSKNVQRRIKKLLDRVEKTEQREKEALRFAESAKKKYEEYENKIKSLDENYLSEYENRVKSQIEQTKKALTDARLNNDVSAEVEAQRALTRLAIEEERALASKQQREALQKQQEGLMAEKPKEQQPAPAQPDPRAEEWAKENEWFGKDEAMTFTALAHHKKLLKEGYDPKSDEYYGEINSYIREQFPHKFEEVKTEEVKEKAPVVVASAARSQKTGGSRKVKLTPSQVAIAKKLGLTVEQYAKYV